MQNFVQKDTLFITSAKNRTSYDISINLSITNATQLLDMLVNYHSQEKCQILSPFNYSSAYIDALMSYKYIVSGWLSLFVILFGLIANSVTICALLHRFMKDTSTNAYLFALTFSNIISLLCLLLMVGLRFTLVHPYRKIYCVHWYENYINLLMPYLTPINNMFQLAGIYLTIAVSFDRYFLITRKIHETTNKKRSKKITRFIICSIFLFSFIFTLPNWFLYKSEIQTTRTIDIDSFKEFLAKNNLESEVMNEQFFITHKLFRSFIQTVKTDFGKNSITRSILHAYLYIPFVFMIPICSLVVVTLLIIYKLVEIKDRKRQLGNHSHLDRSITIMLVMIVIVFLICQVPLMAGHILTTLSADVTLGAPFFIFNSIANLFLCVNLAINFAFYCFFAEAFRKTIRYMFCSRGDPHATPNGFTNWNNNLGFGTENLPKRSFQLQRPLYDVNHRKSMPAVIHAPNRIYNDFRENSAELAFDINENLMFIDSTVISSKSNQESHQNGHNGHQNGRKSSSTKSHKKHQKNKPKRILQNRRYSEQLSRQFRQPLYSDGLV